MRVKWEASQDATSYKVFRAFTADGLKIELDRIDSTTYDDTSVWENITYYYWVRACNASGCSGYSKSDRGYSGSRPRPATQTYLPMILRMP